MKANELRIGNWVYFHDGVFKIEPLTIFNISNEPQNYNPIPITEGILLKCEGIIKHPIIKNRYLLEDSKYSFHIEDGDWDNPSLDVLIGGRYIICVEFLHNFQNLIYALTNQELNIEL